MNYAKTTSIVLATLMVLSACQNNRSSKSTYVIAYSSAESGNGEIYLTDAAGLAKIKLTDHPENDGYPAWSPSGEQIALYAYHDNRTTWSIHTINADGSNRKRLTYAKGMWDSSPSWSADGKQIAFAREYPDEAGNWQEEIWIMNSDGSNQRQVMLLEGGGPYFTPDNKLLFHSKTGQSEICMANADGSDLTQLTSNKAEDWHPELSPDGQQIAFMSDRDGNHEIYIMNIDGSDQRRITRNPARDSSPSWSADGSKLIFAREDASGNYHTYMVNKDGTMERKLIDNAGTPVWLKLKR